jgi:hypothetical protein
LAAEPVSVAAAITGSGGTLDGILTQHVEGRKCPHRRVGEFAQAGSVGIQVAKTPSASRGALHGKPCG